MKIAVDRRPKQIYHPSWKKNPKNITNNRKGCGMIEVMNIDGIESYSDQKAAQEHKYVDLEEHVE